METKEKAQPLELLEITIDIYFDVKSYAESYLKKLPVNSDPWRKAPMFIGREIEDIGLNDAKIEAVVADNQLDTIVRIHGMENSLMGHVDVDYIFSWFLRISVPFLPIKIILWRNDLAHTVLQRFEWNPEVSIHHYYQAYLDPKVMLGMRTCIDEDDRYWKRCKAATYDSKLAVFHYGQMREWNDNLSVRIPCYLEPFTDWMKKNNAAVDAQREAYQKRKEAST